MSQNANVEDIDVFRAAKIALVKFRQTAETALINADGQIMRTLSWLENEQTSHWQSQIRKRTEAVARAREAVRQKKLFKDAAGRTPNAAQEEKTLKLCILALEEAEARLAATKRAIPALRKEIEVYRGTVQGLGSALVSDVPRAIALLERSAAALEDYVNLASSVATSSDTPSPAAPEAGGMTRGGESADSSERGRSSPDKESPDVAR